VNLLHRWYCRSPGWARIVQEQMLPNVLRDADLGDHLLEVGPGPGKTTQWLMERVPRLTAIEIDGDLAARLKEETAGTNVTVVEGDATRMQFPDNEFSAAVCFTMLHHVPSSGLQDRLFAEVCRVLRPGGLFVGSDSTSNLRFRLYHIMDTCVPVDPAELAARLEMAGFRDASVYVRKEGGFSFRAMKPASTV
jgi:ubiquinone/menaquinone biosynthesis C-methylase UbiE